MVGLSLSGVKLSEKLTHLLNYASSGEKRALEAFYETLLASSVYVPLKPSSLGRGEETTVVGEAAVSDYVVVENDDMKILPIFSEKIFIEKWAGIEMNADYKEFKSLVWSVGDVMWLHLNPEQEVGKEISPWEVERLRQGREAIPELVAELESSGGDEIEVNPKPDISSEVYAKLKIILEVYEEVRSAFLVEVRDEEEEGAYCLLLGVKHGGMGDEKLGRLEEELYEILEEEIPEKPMSLVDLHIENNPKARLFDEVTPFYFKVEALIKESFLKKMFSKFKKKR